MNCTEIGTHILAMMIESGLLLTPEDLVVPSNPHAKNRTPPKTVFRQSRACFTLTERSSLWQPPARFRSGIDVSSHSENFGMFAIGLDPIRARLLGAIPVAYFYTDAQEPTIPQEILFHIRELRSLAIALARLEARSQSELGGNRQVFDAKTLDAVGYTLEGDSRVMERIEAATGKEVSKAISLLDTDRPPAWNLVDWIDIVFDFFQTADSKTLPDSLAYYHQREWRIIRLFGPHVQCCRLGADAVLDGNAAMPSHERYVVRKKLKYIDHDFFSDGRLDGSAILSGAKGLPFFDYVEEIVCPVEAVSDVEVLLKLAGIEDQFCSFRKASRDIAFCARRSTTA